MISGKNKKEITDLTFEKRLGTLIQVIIFIVAFSTTYYFDLKYDENTNLFNDKLVDVCSIFFGVFIGSIYLFKKLKDSYEDFIKFSKKLLVQNLAIIFMSFFVMLYSDELPIDINLFDYLTIKPRVILFSIYVGFFCLTLWNIKRFITMVTKMLMEK
jgi:NAD/NADP transhydrogenase beta subunit